MASKVHCESICCDELSVIQVLMIPPCNILFIIYSPKQKIVKFHAQKQIGKVT